MAKLFTDSFSAPNTETKISDVTSEVPEWSQETEGWTERSLDLNMLWEVLEKHKKVMQERDKAAGNIGNTWELVVVQTVILVILALIALMWGFCCRKQCFANNNDTVSVSEALRKLSKDLPPSYSMRDLHTLGISVDDHLHPPPAYLELFKDDLQYLDLEAGHSRMAKLSFCNGDQGPPRLARLSVASCATCSNESPVVVPVERLDNRRPSLSWSRRSSATSGSVPGSSSSASSGRTSRVSFSEEVVCSNGSVRRLSSNSRKSSSTSSEGSRKSSLASKMQEVKRKLGSQSSTSRESFMSQLDEELQSKLKNIGKPDPSVELKVESETKAEEVADSLILSPLSLASPSPSPSSSSSSPSSSPPVKVVTPETQAERAARVCDIVHEK